MTNVEWHNDVFGDWLTFHLPPPPSLAPQHSSSTCAFGLQDGGHSFKVQSVIQLCSKAKRSFCFRISFFFPPLGRKLFPEAHLQISFQVSLAKVVAHGDALATRESDWWVPGILHFHPLERESAVPERKTQWKWLLVWQPALSAKAVGNQTGLSADRTYALLHDVTF